MALEISFSVILSFVGSSWESSHDFPVTLVHFAGSEIKPFVCFAGSGGSRLDSRCGVVVLGVFNYNSPIPPGEGAVIEAASLDAADWVRRNLGFAPDVQQCRVLATGIRRGILNCTRQWGKSTVSAAMAVHRAAETAESLTVVVSPSARQSGEFVRKAVRFALKLGVKAKGDGDNEISLLFPNGSRIVGLPGTEATIRGFSAVSLLLVDEASRVSDDMYMAVRPMLAVSGGDLWLMSTPFGKRGFFWEAWNELRRRVGTDSCARSGVPANFARVFG
jgi:hypothetical protein